MIKRLLIVFVLLNIAFLTMGAGYVGSLPDIEAEFSYLKKDVSSKTNPPMDVPALSEEEESKLVPVPRDNKDYVNIMVKRDKTSEYEQDVNQIILIIEKLKKVIYLNLDIQKFNAVVSNYIDHAAFLQKKYKDKKEASYVSYNRILDLSNQARSVAILWSEAKEYQDFLPYSTSNNAYTKENIDKKLLELQNSVEDTLYILKNLE